jgi:hypothetical protein
MSLRDYFMAHAPAKPQKWFMPKMPPCPAVPSDKHPSLTQEQRDDLDAANNEGVASQWALDWCTARDAAADAQADWQAEFRKQLCVQWPAAWADEMLKARQA